MNNKTVRLMISISLNAIAIALAVFFIYSVGTKGFEFGAKIFNEQSIDSESTAREVEVTIPEKVTTKQLAKILYNKDLIDDVNVFYFQVELSDYKGKFIAGTYKVKSSMKPTELMAALCTAASETTAE